MSEDRCEAIARLQDERVPCELHRNHGWAHQNEEHELIWTDDAEQLRQAIREFAWGLGAATASKAQILAVLERKPFVSE